MPDRTVLSALVVDDNEVNLEVIKGMLEYAGHRVNPARSAHTALEMLAGKSYDFVVLDCLMPGMDGFEAARKIRAYRGSKWNPDIPILAVTALASEQDRLRCLDAGMTGYISKPISADVLFAWIANQFDKVAKEYPDTTSGSALTGQWNTLIRKVSKILIRDAEEWQTLLPGLLASNNTVELAALAHKIRGAADAFGLRDLSEISVKLEGAGKAGDSPEVSRQVPALIRSLSQLVDEFHGST